MKNNIRLELQANQHQANPNNQIHPSTRTSLDKHDWKENLKEKIRFSENEQHRKPQHPGAGDDETRML